MIGMEMGDMPDIKPIKGRVWKFGDNISTTDIQPSEMFRGTSNYTKRDIVFAAIRPDWKNEVKHGDCIVAGKNFGFGSQRQKANDVMKEMHIGCIVADSIARVYFRNAVAIGFPVFICPGVSAMFEEGQEIELDVVNGVVRNVTTGQMLQGIPYPPQIKQIMQGGGLIPLLVQRVKEMGE